MNRSNKPYAIIVGLDCITGLQTARILARHKVPTIGIASDQAHWACSTTACERVIEANTESAEVIRVLEQLGPTLERKAVLYPCTDLSVLSISEGRDRIAKWFHIALPAHEIVKALIDKVSFVDFANQHGIAIPRTFLLRNRKDAIVASEALDYPCIMKPPIRTVEWESNASAKVLTINSREELLDAYDAHSTIADVLIAQQWVDGTDADLYSCNCYFDRHSKPLVSFVAKKIRQWPPVTGVSCLGEEVKNDTVRDETLKLFVAACYHGLGYVEMKRDRRNGAHYVIEPNIGRPTGRSAIAEAGDVELLYTMYCDLTGAELPLNREQRYTGVKWIYLRQDLRSAWHYWRCGQLTVIDWMKSIRGKKAYAVLSLRDPLPFLYDLIGTFRKSVRRVKSQ